MRKLVLHEADQLRRWRIFFRGSIKHGESLQQAKSVEEGQSDCLHIAQSSTVIITIEDFWIMALTGSAVAGPCTTASYYLLRS